MRRRDTLDPNAQPTLIEGQVERVTYENDETGFHIIKVSVGDSLVTVVGKMQRVAPGAAVRVTGVYETDPRYGKQLRAETVLVVEPDTLDGVARYLGSGLIPGVGPALAERIVNTFGAGTLAVLDQHPERLAEVPGFGSKRAEAVRKSWSDQRVAREVLVFLQGHGVTAATAMRIFRRYGGDAIRVVQDNPYQLASEVWGIGFRKADEIAARLGVDKQAPQRIRAAVLHVLDTFAERGHVFAPQPLLADEVAALTGSDPGLVEEAIDAVCATSEARKESLDDIGTVVYSSRRYIEEAGLARSLASLCQQAAPALRGVDEAIATYEASTGTKLAPAQRQAVSQTASQRVLVITGGPGVGKTTVVRAIVGLFSAASLRVRLAAPTGRASRRLTEATGRDAQTIHRLLEFDPSTGGFVRSESRPLELDVLVVDEASMLDQSLAFALVRALPRDARLVLVGDVDQLPSIGAGAVLRDVIASGVVGCVRMNEVFRQATESRIVRSAHRIKEGLPPEATPPGDRHGDFYLLRVRDADDAASRIVRLVSDRIPAQFGLDPSRDVQVLTPMHRGAAGSDAMNRQLQAVLNSAQQDVAFGGRTFRVGDKVMQLRNDYDRDVFNGDVGFVRSIDPQAGVMTVEVDGRAVTYEPSQADELTLAYACSVHKSQGSEYPAVVVALLSSHFVMLSRNLLYTAVTRGKRLVVLLTDDKALRCALADTRREERYSWLFQRLRDAAGG